jgi:hypothetical protein
MNYQSPALTMSDSFETKKNTQASMITLGVAGSLLLIFILIKFEYPAIQQPVFDDLVEVNLGNSDFGSGNDQPLLPGQPASSEQTAYNPPSPVKSVEDNAKDVETDDKNPDVAIKKPVITKPNATKIDNDNKVIKTTPKPQPVIVQAPPKPKAVLNGIHGGNANTNGNGADSYQKGNGEGNTGGNGDQGRPNGTPGGKDYTGTPRNLGLRVVNIPSSRFEDEFDEKGKIALDITVNENGKLVSASFQPRGSTISSRKQIDIAIRRAGEINYPKYPGGFKQTIIVNFSLHG